MPREAHTTQQGAPTMTLLYQMLAIITAICAIAFVLLLPRR
jgi:hypothetical protein